MANAGFLVFLLFNLLAIIMAEDTDSGPCYRIATGALAGVVLGDIILTVFIVGVTYCYASKRRCRKENADKVYMNVRANCKP
ncbi:hematopoietic cell signal transducer [Electrophorus electricus]|uniref:Hematopoietic cell signal transducer n=1 Tax=Electrophorus electricus TaxID=8005 RepID=A0A4W4GD76_ELEEL|nr:hematopoietic cell signal transducer [Electrophorus electricus]XP_035386299.1 hematopoietic cell signal transducer [Electrophorus electricus]XP_035386300.1 hematopoietic cell signal transducer [Electrophorus electricus]